MTRHHAEQVGRTEVRCHGAGVLCRTEGKSAIDFLFGDELHNLMVQQGLEDHARAWPRHTKPLDRGADQAVSERCRGRHRHHPALGIAQIVSEPVDRLHRRERLDQFGKQLARFGGRCERPANAQKQGKAKLRLRLLEEFADGRLRHPQHTGRLSDASRLHDGAEDLKLPEARVHNLDLYGQSF